MKQLTIKNADLVWNIFKNSPSYFLRVDGCEPTLKMAENALTDGPKKKTPAYLKEFFLLTSDEAPVGVVDLHIHHPENEISYLGLLLIDESFFGKKLGSKFYFLVENYLKENFRIKAIRLGVSDDNDVSDFWKKMGFKPNGHTYSWQGESKTTHVVELEKQLS